MFSMSTDAVLLRLTSALLGTVLGLIVYLDVDPLGSAPLLALPFAAAGITAASLFAYSFSRFLILTTPEEASR